MALRINLHLVPGDDAVPPQLRRVWAEVLKGADDTCGLTDAEAAVPMVSLEAAIRAAMDAVTTSNGRRLGSYCRPTFLSTESVPGMPAVLPMRSRSKSCVVAVSPGVLRNIPRHAVDLNRVTLNSMRVGIARSNVGFNIDLHVAHIDGLLRTGQPSESRKASFARSFARLASNWSQQTAQTPPADLIDAKELRQKKKGSASASTDPATDSAASSSSAEKQASVPWNEKIASVLPDRVLRDANRYVKDVCEKAELPVDTTTWYYRPPPWTQPTDLDLRGLLGLDTNVEGTPSAAAVEARGQAPPVSTLREGDRKPNDEGRGIVWLEALAHNFNISPLPDSEDMRAELQTAILQVTKLSSTGTILTDRRIVDRACVRAACALPLVAETAAMLGTPTSADDGLPEFITAFDIALAMYRRKASATTADLCGYAVDTRPSFTKPIQLDDGRSVTCWGFYVENIERRRVNSEEGPTHPLDHTWVTALRNLIVTMPTPFSLEDEAALKVRVRNMDFSYLDVVTALDGKNTWRLHARAFMRHYGHDTEYTPQPVPPAGDAGSDGVPTTTTMTTFEFPPAWISTVEEKDADGEPAATSSGSASALLSQERTKKKKSRRHKSSTSSSERVEWPDNETYREKVEARYTLERKMVSMAAMLDANIADDAGCGDGAHDIAARYLACIDARSFNLSDMLRTLRDPRGADIARVTALPLPERMTRAPVPEDDEKTIASDDDSDEANAWLMEQIQGRSDVASKHYLFRHAIVVVDNDGKQVTDVAKVAAEGRRLRHAIVPTSKDLSHRVPATALHFYLAACAKAANAHTLVGGVCALIGELRARRYFPADAHETTFTTVAETARTKGDTTAGDLAQLAAGLRHMLDVIHASRPDGIPLVADLDEAMFVEEELRTA